MARFLRDWEGGAAREAVARDYEEAVTLNRVRAIPTIIVEGGRRLTGLVDLPTYRKAIEEV